MTSTAALAEVAAMVGEPARAGMLQALMDGRALTAAELARAAGITPQTASGHLARLTMAGLITVEAQGRHRYHRIASPGVARMMESLMRVASDGQATRPGKRLTVGPRDLALRRARTCYDHLAGGLGVALADALVAEGHVELSSDAGMVTRQGRAFLADLGLELPERQDGGGTPARMFCRPCLDWSERRPHIAGRFGAALCTHSLANGWIMRTDGTRAVAVTPKGLRVFRERFRAAFGDGS
jgi:DNA-binding transcriptional ArsR family regulator